jgi:hypothetical protein
LEGQASPDATEHDGRYRYQYYLTPTRVSESVREEPSLAELARVIKAGACIEASFKRGKGEAGMDEYHIPSHLVVTSRSSHNPLDLSMCYHHHVSSASTATPREMRHGTGRQSSTPQPDHHRRLPR